MPSFSHEAIIELFRARTTLAPELLEDVFAVQLPHYTKAITSEPKLTQIVPTEYTADLVILLEDDRPVFGIVVEVQLRTDPTKSFSWPLYAMALRARHEIPVEVLVVTPSQRVAAWASAPITTGFRNQFTVMVVGPNAVPRVTTEAEALRAPELGVLSAIAHGNEPRAGPTIAEAAVLGLRGVGDKARRVYYDLILASVGEAARKGLEAMVQSGKYEYLSDFAKKYVAEGRQEGRQEGRVADLAVLAIEDGRSPREIQARVQAASEEDLQTWLLRAVTAANLSAVFDS